MILSSSIDFFATASMFFDESTQKKRLKDILFSIRCFASIPLDPQAKSIILESGSINVGDAILIIGPTTGVIKTTIKEIFVNDKSASSAKKGDSITIPIEEKVRPSDKLYLIKEKN